MGELLPKGHHLIYFQEYLVKFEGLKIKLLRVILYKRISYRDAVAKEVKESEPIPKAHPAFTQ